MDKTNIFMLVFLPWKRPLRNRKNVFQIDQLQPSSAKPENLPQIGLVKFKGIRRTEIVEIKKN